MVMAAAFCGRHFMLKKAECFILVRIDKHLLQWL
jgi:hypothetical protein